jgi:hypothetical protein
MVAVGSAATIVGQQWQKEQYSADREKDLADVGQGAEVRIFVIHGFERWGNGWAMSLERAIADNPVMAYQFGQWCDLSLCQKCLTVISVKISGFS